MFFTYPPFFLFFIFIFIILLQELSRLILHLSFSLLSSLDVRTELLATQFYIIDAALLKAIGSEELARSPSPWLLLNSKLSPADRWEDSLREKTVAKTDPTRTKLSDVAMMVTRFELMARWVETEVVITEKAGRVALVNRFIKLAAKCYSLNNLLYVPPPHLLAFPSMTDDAHPLPLLSPLLSLSLPTAPSPPSSSASNAPSKPPTLPSISNTRKSGPNSPPLSSSPSET
jgi:hypothetical protein